MSIMYIIILCFFSQPIRCVPSLDCPPMVCMMHCEHGMKENSEGCPICECNPGPNEGNGDDDISPGHDMQDGSVEVCPPMRCLIYCEHGSVCWIVTYKGPCIIYFNFWDLIVVKTCFCWFIDELLNAYLMQKASLGIDRYFVEYWKYLIFSFH